MARNLVFGIFCLRNQALICKRTSTQNGQDSRNLHTDKSHSFTPERHSLLDFTSFIFSHCFEKFKHDSCWLFKKIKWKIKNNSYKTVPILNEPLCVGPLFLRLTLPFFYNQNSYCNLPIKSKTSAIQSKYLSFSPYWAIILHRIPNKGFAPLIDPITMGKLPLLVF